MPTKSSSRSGGKSLIENEAKARLSKELVKLDDEVPLPCPLGDLRVTPLDLDRLLPFLRKMEFRALATRLSQRLSGPAALAAAAATAGPSEPVIPEILPFSAPRSYAIVDTDRRPRALDRGGRAGRSGRDLAGAERRRRDAARSCAAWRWRLRREWPPICRLGHRPAGLLDAAGSTGKLSLDAGDRAVEAAVRRPRGLEDRPRHEGRGASVAALRHQRRRRMTARC